MSHYGPAAVYRADRNGMGTAGLVLGILAILTTLTLIFIPLAWILAGIGLILALVGFSRANRGEASNKGIALAGIITSSAAIGLSFLLIFGFGVSLGSSNPSTAKTRPGTSSGPAPSSAAAKPAGPATSFGPGTWVVGEDIVPGTYKSAGAEEDLFEFCSVITYAGDAADGNVIAINSANANEPIRIKVSGKVKSVKTSGCATFTKV